MSKTKDYIADQQAARMDVLKDAKSDDVVDSEEAKDYQLHISAGLMPAGRDGLDEEGAQMWTGTDKQWEDYEHRVEAEGRSKDLPF